MEQVKQKVALLDIRFFSYHGFYPEEQLCGNVFYLDIETIFELKRNIADDITATVNYEKLFQIASEEMRKTRKLLETVAESILERIKAEFPFIEQIRIAIRKQNPPFRGTVGASLVELTYKK